MLIQVHFAAWKIKLPVISLLHFMPLKAFEGDKDDDHNKFYQTIIWKSSYFLKCKEIILKRIIWLTM